MRFAEVYGGWQARKLTQEEAARCWGAIGGSPGTSSIQRGFPSAEVALPWREGDTEIQAVASDTGVERVGAAMILSAAAVLASGMIVALLAVWLVGERGRLLQRSTAVILREAGLRHVLDGSALHGYVYGRWIRQYLRVLIHQVVPRLGPRGKRWLADRYHGKVLTHDQARSVITLDRPIPLRDLEQIIPYPKARELVLNAPPEVAVMECGCRHAREEPCQPTQVCMVIGQPFVDFMLEHHPSTCRRLSRAQALELLDAEHGRGHLHAAWFKDACFGRFYSICNCCKCCCAGVEGMVKRGVPLLAASGYVAQVDNGRCKACGTCAGLCPFAAVSMEEGETALRWEACMGCGVCVDGCPNGARSLVRDPRKGIPLDVGAIARECSAS